MTPRSSIASRQRSQRTGLAIWPTIRASTSWPSWTTWPSLLEISGVRGSWTDTDRARPAEVADGGGHVVGVERAGDAQLRQPCLGRRVGGEGLELLEGAGGDDLAGAVVVGGGQSVLVERGEHLVAVAPEDGGHAGGRGGGGLGHRVAALADQHHRLLGGDHPGTSRGGELSHAVAGHGTDLAERVGRVGEQLQRRDQPGRDQQRLGDAGVADGLGVGLGAVVDQVEVGDGGQPLEARGELGSSSHGVRKPGDWAPWPGATMTSTGTTLPGTGPSVRLRRARIPPLGLCRVPTTVSWRPDWRPSTSAMCRVNASRARWG